MIILLILFLCCFFTIIISKLGYDSYKDYTELDNNEIKSLDNFKDFLKFIFDRIVKWIKCNILGVFYRKYRQECFTGAVILSQEDETRLDSAEPGSLSKALWELRADQARQTEDYLRANEALDGLENAIVEKDAAQVFDRSDEVQMDEEALMWRAWITAQTSQMTHNLVNMEICDENGNVVDYMDLAANGLDKQGNTIPDNRTSDANDYKTGKDFRWSNRCRNRSGATMGVESDCYEPDNTLMGENAREKYWIEEKAHEPPPGVAHNELDPDGNNAHMNDPHGIDTRNITNDLDVFHVSDFSGYNCNFYAKHFCKNGIPDYNNHSDMFGMLNNWPELNCCACGGGSRTDVQDHGAVNKNKHELIFKDLNKDYYDYETGHKIWAKAAWPRRPDEYRLDPVLYPGTEAEREGSDTGQKYWHYSPSYDGVKHPRRSNPDSGMRWKSTWGLESATKSDDPNDINTRLLLEKIDHTNMDYCLNDVARSGGREGIIFDVLSPISINDEGRRNDKNIYFQTKQDMDLKSHLHPGDNDHTFIYKIKSAHGAGSSCKYIFHARLSADTPELKVVQVQEAIDDLFNRNYVDENQSKTTLSAATSQLILKKMPPEFQNLDTTTNTIQSEHIDENRTTTHDHEYDIDYDLPIKSDTFGGNITNCSELCDNLDNYKVKDGQASTPCPPEGCKRSQCCELNTCGNSDVDCNSGTCIGPDNIEYPCGPNYDKNANIICEESGCTTQQCCYKARCQPPPNATVKSSCTSGQIKAQPLYYWDISKRVNPTGTENFFDTPGSAYIDAASSLEIDRVTCYGNSNGNNKKQICGHEGNATWTYIN